MRIIYAQGDTVILIKETDSCTLTDKTVYLTLSQSETLSFNSEQLAKVQIRVLTAGGEALSSPPMTIPVDRCLDREVLL